MFADISVKFLARLIASYGKLLCLIKGILYPSFVQLVLIANLDVLCLNWYTELYENFFGKVSISFVIPVTLSNLPASSAALPTPDLGNVIADR